MELKEVQYILRPIVNLKPGSCQSFSDAGVTLDHLSLYANRSLGFGSGALGCDICAL